MMKRLAVILLLVFAFGCAHTSWPPDEATIKQLCAEKGVNRNIIHFVFQEVKKGMTISTFPCVVIIEPCPEWRDVLDWELDNVRLRQKIGESYREEIHHRR